MKKVIFSEPYQNSDAIIILRNSQSSVYKSMNKFNKALYFLQKAENMLKANPDLLSGLTFLNICQNLSSLKRHESALFYASEAARHCAKKISLINVVDFGQLYPKMRKRINRKLVKEIDYLATSKYNMGVQNQYLGDYEAAYELFKESINIIDSRDPPNQKLRDMCEKSKLIVFKVSSPFSFLIFHLLHYLHFQETP